MKKIRSRTGLMFFIAVGLAASTSWAANTATRGADVYTCDCEEGCPCPSPYLEPGKCECGLDLAKMRVLKIEGGKAYLYMR